MRWRGTSDHATVAINAIEYLRRELGARSCRVYNSDMAVRLSPSDYRFPDAAVSCDERYRGRATEVRSPQVIVEVLSDSTEKEDRTAKFALARAYRSTC